MEPTFLGLHTNRKNPRKFYGFHTFAEPGCPVSLSGAFRDNIRHFLRESAALEDYDVEGMPVWCTFLVYESKGVVLPLFTVEENVKHSNRPFCDYCHCAGWSNHFVSKRKYHFIIPVDDEWNKSLDEGAFDLQSHFLHGLIHCNGFGHLLCINGIEGGSKIICGRELMDLWDRICTSLHARKISVEDASKKHMMDLRLLYGVAYGHSWFGRWGYQLCHGSFGVKWHNYEKAINILSSLELDQVIDDLSFTNGFTYIKQIIHQYRNLSEASLVTVRDLFRFILTLKMKTPAENRTTISAAISQCSRKNSRFFAPVKVCSWKISTGTPIKNCPFAKEKSFKCRKFSNLAANMASRWPVRRLEHAAGVIVDALKEKREESKGCHNGMTRQEVRDAARMHVGDTGLIDHVLKAMHNVIVGKYVIQRAVNRSTKVLEYSIQDLNSVKFGACPATVSKTFHTFGIVPGKNVYEDLYLFYTYLFRDYPKSESVQLAVQAILCSKLFVKEWHFRDEEDDLLRFVCRLTISSLDLNTELFPNFPLQEFIIVPPYSTIGDLKLSLQNALRDTYFVTERLVVTDVVELEGMEDDEVLFGIIESGSELSVRGFGLDNESDLRYEGGAENWTVRCKCGAEDDDGERMVSCDICEIWQHTRCNGVEDTDTVPRLFVCDVCCSNLAPVQTACGLGFELDQSYKVPMVLPHMPELNMGSLYCK
ncbi:LOW QUALITY PROTEIN: PHD finger protein MALE MEIOCYTE DEATH 1-like [Primulina eburnea]|uniref:LOW QUALITY PROTEIN: PHD finger protein MALE MEIOCYTE DEATH 1-like n=1 Tax=Primulina eburnea TaxID=1245227 RepID=UPI003C6C18B9